MFPAGRQLPHLQELNIAIDEEVPHNGDPFPIPDCIRLVSCCPGLQHLNMEQLEYSNELLALLQGLMSLSTLKLGHHHPDSEGEELLGPVCQLTGLRELRMLCPAHAGLLLQLTQLRQLTRLECAGVTGCDAMLYADPLTFISRVSHHKPLACYRPCLPAVAAVLLMGLTQC
jgi:hypothetical protein